MSQTLRTLLVAIVLTVAGLTTATTASAAAAHGGPGEMTTIEASPAGTSVKLAVGIKYRNDGEFAEGAVVTTTATGPDGAVLTEVQLSHFAGGRYEAVIDLPIPGRWRFHVTSKIPPASQDVSVDVPNPAATTTSPAAPLPSTSPTAATSLRPEPAPSTVEDDASGSGLVLGLVAVLAAAFLATLVVIRRGRPSNRPSS